MDYLIKNNITKGSKAIVDIGEYRVKVLTVRYAVKRVEIKSSDIFDSSDLIRDGIIDMAQLAHLVSAVAGGRARRDVTVILPSNMTEDKIVAVRNRRESDIPGIIEKEYQTLGKVSSISSVLDYAFLGKKEEQGDSVGYYLLSAASKSQVNELITEFSDYGLKVTRILSSATACIALSELYYDDYEDLNRLFIDFGTNTCRITAFSEGIPVYTRRIEYGFNTYVLSLLSKLRDADVADIREVLYSFGCTGGSEVFRELSVADKEKYERCLQDINKRFISEIARVTDMCEGSDIRLTKIYHTGFAIPGIDNIITKETGLSCEKIEFSYCDEKEGKGYILWADTELTGAYSNAVGAAIYPML